MSQHTEIAIKNRFAAICQMIQAEEIQTEAQEEGACDKYIENCRGQHPREWASIADSCRRVGCRASCAEGDWPVRKHCQFHSCQACRRMLQWRRCVFDYRQKQETVQHAVTNKMPK